MFYQDYASVMRGAQRWTVQSLHKILRGVSREIRLGDCHQPSSIKSCSTYIFGLLGRQNSKDMDPAQGVSGPFSEKN